jgi:hypothetical protein
VWMWMEEDEGEEYEGKGDEGGKRPRELPEL